MVSSTQQTSRIRRRKAATNGRAQKRARALAGTPKFPIHPDGGAAKAVKPAAAKASAAKPAAAKK